MSCVCILLTTSWGSRLLLGCVVLCLFVIIFWGWRFVLGRVCICFVIYHFVGLAVFIWVCCVVCYYFLGLAASIELCCVVLVTTFWGWRLLLSCVVLFLLLLSGVGGFY